MKILSIKDSIIAIEKQKDLFINQIIIFDKKIKGVILKSTGKNAFVVVDDASNITLNSKVEVSDKVWAVKAKNSLLGKIIDVYENTIYDEFNSQDNDTKYKVRDIDTKAPMFVERVKLDKPLETGMFPIDSLIPIGRGQRELIIGDRKTGKTSIALSTIINQKNKKVKVIYVAIGQKYIDINSTYKILNENGALEYTTIITASPDKKLSQYLAPYVGMTYAESFAENNEDVLIVFDDLSKHANILRELSLNMNKSGGREAYPSDLFYSHSKLLERSGRFVSSLGGGSITALPIIETIDGDFATLLATNIISITDGQIITDIERAKEGLFPAINIGLSVSRTGSSVQNKLMKDVSKSILKIYTKYLEAIKYEVISLEVSDEVKQIINNGKALMTAFEQFGYKGKTPVEMYLMAKLLEWDIVTSIFSNNKNNITIDELIQFAVNDKTGKIILENFALDENASYEILKGYFRSLCGIENKYQAKRAARELRGDYE